MLDPAVHCQCFRFRSRAGPIRRGPKSSRGRMGENVPRWKIDTLWLHQNKKNKKNERLSECRYGLAAISGSPNSPQACRPLCKFAVFQRPRTQARASSGLAGRSSTASPMDATPPLSASHLQRHSCSAVGGPAGCRNTPTFNLISSVAVLPRGPRTWRRPCGRGYFEVASV